MVYPVSLLLASPPGVLLPFTAARGKPAEDTPDDAFWVAEALLGKRVAQHALYSRHFARVYTRAARLLGRSADTDDVVQDAFVCAFRDLAKLAEPGSFGAWVCGIAVHQVHRRLRRRQLLRRLGIDRFVDDLSLAQSADPAAGPELRTLLAQVDEGLARLSAAHRVAWVLRHVEGCSLDEVAAQCRVSLATAKRHIASAEAALRQHIDFERAAAEPVGASDEA